MKITRDLLSLLVITVKSSEIGEKRRKLAENRTHNQGKLGKCYLRPQQCCAAETNDCYGCEEHQLLQG